MEHSDFISMILLTPLDAWHDGEHLISILLGIMLILMLGVLLMLAVLICYGIIRVADTWFVSTQTGRGRIRAKQFSPAHTITMLMFNPALKMATPMTYRVPNDYAVRIAIEGKNGWISVDRSHYNQLQTGNSIRIRYRWGRITGKLYIKDIL